ncbi:MAG TPA: N-acetylneuraminate synthase family protein [Thermohalobaculum sp.]|nr:N-acetylneuraminate synthase family protein [Thermohalobaculum sp.]
MNRQDTNRFRLDWFDFSNLFVLDMANNHQGRVEHGLNVIRGAAEPVAKHGVRAGIKFQFRQLDSFVHPTHREGSDNKHIPRFLATELKRPDYETLLAEVRRHGMLGICTPFDEPSVDMVVDMGFDILKIASCSATDWPLLEKAADANLPVICSTGGLEQHQIDELASFFFHRGVAFALMHCVSIYPTPDDRLNLNQIAAMRKRYPYATVGWSTHEDQDNTAAVQVAHALGARMFERHIGLETDEIKLNAYSSRPDQLDRWFGAWARAQAMMGPEARPAPDPVEQAALRSLQRGVYAREPLEAGATLAREAVYFAMPCLDGQMPSGEWKPYAVTAAAVEADGPLMANAVELPPEPEELGIKHAVHKVKALLNEAGVQLGSEFGVEYSHHEGIGNFEQVGCVLIDCVNRSYAKKIVVQLPGQHHPLHFHKQKEETFQVLFGSLSVEVDGHVKRLSPGDTCLVQPGVWHRFWTDDGCVFEEISTRAIRGDSIYADKRINDMGLDERKTVVDHWGRFQMKSGALSWT